jgi:hypothetical protein
MPTLTSIPPSTDFDPNFSNVFTSADGSFLLIKGRKKVAVWKERVLQFDIDHLDAGFLFLSVDSTILMGSAFGDRPYMIVTWDITTGVLIQNAEIHEKEPIVASWLSPDPTIFCCLKNGMLLHLHGIKVLDILKMLRKRKVSVKIILPLLRLVCLAIFSRFIILIMIIKWSLFVKQKQQN